MLPPLYVRNKPVLPSPVQRLGEVDGVFFEILEVHKFERGLMRRPEHDPRRFARLQRLQPPSCAETPSVTRFQAREAKVWNWRRKIVAARLREREKVVGHLDADRMQSGVLRTRVAAAGPIESCQWPVGTRLDGIAEDVSLPFEGV